MTKEDWLDHLREIKIAAYDKELKIAYEHYISKVEEIATKARRELLVPYLHLNGCEFTQGNGWWSIFNPSKIRYLPNGHRDWRSHDHNMVLQGLPDWLTRLLELEVGTAQGNPELALWMLDYTTRKTKNKGGTNG